MESKQKHKSECGLLSVGIYLLKVEQVAAAGRAVLSPSLIGLVLGTDLRLKSLVSS